MTSMTTHINSTVKSTLKKAESVYGSSFPMIEIRNDIRGKCAGQFCRKAGGHKYLRFNPVLWKENKDTFDSTIIHEVAHYIQIELYPMSKPHGPEWKSVMTRLGANPRRCHSMKTSNAGKLKSKYVYSCNCKDHNLTIIRHNKCVKKGTVYTCNTCKTALKFKKKIWLSSIS